MGLFFLLSGYFGALLVKRKGLKKFLLNRGLRIALPMVVFFPFFGRGHDVGPSSRRFRWIRKTRPDGLDRQLDCSGENAGADSTDQSTLGWMHLWFLYYLLIFSLLRL